jgi:hypothetical protein
MQQARLQTETAYHAAELGMQKRPAEPGRAGHGRRGRRTPGRCWRSERKFRMPRAAAAAAKMADQDGFAKDLAGGMSVEQALYRHPHLTTPSGGDPGAQGGAGHHGRAIGIVEAPFGFAGTGVEGAGEPTG